MFNTKIKKFITTMAVAAVTFGVFAPFNNHETHAVNSTVHADSTVAADGPWETGSTNNDLIQPVSNGNQIYYSVDPNAPYTQYAINAANAWSNLGVIQLVQVPWGDSRSQIDVTYNANYPDEGDINAHTSFEDGYDKDGVTYLTKTHIVMTKMMNKAKAVVKEVIMEHEFGHALGFAHDNRKLNNGKRYRGYHLTMNAYGIKKTYQLGGIEQRMLVDHYHIQPANGYLNTNC